MNQVFEPFNYLINILNDNEFYEVDKEVTKEDFARRGEFIIGGRTPSIPAYTINKDMAHQREMFLYGTSEPNGKMNKRVCEFIREEAAKNSSFDIASYLKQLMSSELSSSVGDNLITTFAKCCSCIYEVIPLSCYSEIYTNLIKKFENIRYNIFSEAEWRKLYQYAELHGLFRLAVVLRKKYKTALKSYNDKNLLWRKIQCSLEDNELDEVVRLLSDICNIDSYNKYCRKDLDTALWFVDIMKNNAKASDDYSEFLHNKKIHIYGPLEYKTKRNSQDEIVIRIDDRLNRDADDKTNVLYINYEVSEMMKNYPAEYWEQFDFVSLKDKGLLINAHNIRKMKNFSNLFLFGFPNMIPLILSDLHFSGAKDIYLSGINMYCSNKAYGEGYEGYYVMQDSQARKHRIQDWCIHDVLSQHYFMKNLYDKSFFVPCDELKTVLTMTDEEYALNMEREHLPELLEE